ncbi:hypothetical protein [Spirillospora albida]|uniref:hypothetical protein n=1 Tax=Spirillospora albida TaxID=58123 RepID=UPI0004BF8DB2|nr:hypothetical protein [Spirillospora albida]
MDEREDTGHEPAVTHDRDFAPVNQGSDARGRTTGTSGPRNVPGARPDDEDEPLSGTGTPSVTREHPDSLPPTERGVQEAEAHDDSR